MLLAGQIIQGFNISILLSSLTEHSLMPGYPVTIETASTCVRKPELREELWSRVWVLFQPHKRIPAFSILCVWQRPGWEGFEGQLFYLEFELKGSSGGAHLPHSPAPSEREEKRAQRFCCKSDPLIPISFQAFLTFFLTPPSGAVETANLM